MAHEIQVSERVRENTAVVCGRVGHDAVGRFIGSAFGQVLSVVDEADVTGPPFCRIDMAGDEFLLEVGFPVGRAVEPQGRVVPSSLPGGPVATLQHVGSYESIAPAYAELEQWLRAHGYEPAGAPWEAYLDGPEVPEPRTVVCWPCRQGESRPSDG